MPGTGSLAYAAGISPFSIKSLRLVQGVTPLPAHKRVIWLVDARLPSGSARLLAWDVVLQGRQDLSSWLCRAADQSFFLLCHSGNRPELPPAIVPLSPVRAATWFAAHSRHLGDWDEPTGPALTSVPSGTPRTLAD